jgi:hypothetical protein
MSRSRSDVRLFGQRDRFVPVSEGVAYADRADVPDIHVIYDEADAREATGKALEVGRGIWSENLDWKIGSLGEA